MKKVDLSALIYIQSRYNQRQRPTRGCGKAYDTANMRLSNCSGDKCIQKKTQKTLRAVKQEKKPQQLYDALHFDWKCCYQIKINFLDSRFVFNWKFLPFTSLPFGDLNKFLGIGLWERIPRIPTWCSCSFKRDSCCWSDVFMCGTCRKFWIAVVMLAMHIHVSLLHLVSPWFAVLWCCAFWWHYKEGLLQCNEMNKPVEKRSGFLRSGVPDFFDRRNIFEYCRTCMQNPVESSFQPTSAITESRCVRTLAHSEWSLKPETTRFQFYSNDCNVIMTCFNLWYCIPLVHVLGFEGFDSKLVASSPFFQALPSPDDSWIWKWDNKERKRFVKKIHDRNDSWAWRFQDSLKDWTLTLLTPWLKHIEVTLNLKISDSERFLLRLGQGHVRAFQLLLQRVVVGLQRWPKIYAI